MAPKLTPFEVRLIAIILTCFSLALILGAHIYWRKINMSYWVTMIAVDTAFLIFSIVGWLVFG